MKYLNHFQKATESDIIAVRNQLGRPPRGMLSVAFATTNTDELSAKLATKSGEPVVVLTSPRVEARKGNNGTKMEPFPTLFYLTHPAFASSISKLEANGFMKELTSLITPDSENYDENIAKNYADSHKLYIQLRDDLADELGVERLTETHCDFSAGGMPDRVKCLHAIIGYTLALRNLNLDFTCEIGEIAIKKLLSECV